jgi:CubicO group peptidase (beta-lactamase class C family)
LLVTWTLVLAVAAPAALLGQEAEYVYPGNEWETIANPEDVGYSAEILEKVHKYADAIETTGLVVVVGGRVLVQYGDVEQLSYLASVRKSILAMLYGNYVADGTIDLNWTLEDLGMDDVQGLLPIEKQATVEHLITARSGVYHPASNAGDNTADAPERGTQRPGQYLLYNNWDFNAAGAAFELMTARTSTTRYSPTWPSPSGCKISTASGSASRATPSALRTRPITCGSPPVTWPVSAT